MESDHITSHMTCDVGSCDAHFLAHLMEECRKRKHHGLRCYPREFMCLNQWRVDMPDSKAMHRYVPVLPKLLNGLRVPVGKNFYSASLLFFLLPS